MLCRFAAATCLLMGVWGCGGGGYGGQAAITPVTVSVDWAGRSPSPLSAQSAVITIFGGRPDGTDFNWLISRPPGGKSSASYTSPVPFRVGTLPITARFYDGPNGEGQLCGVWAATVRIYPDGSGIPVVAPQAAAGYVVLADGVSSAPIAISAQGSPAPSNVVTPFAAAWDPNTVVSFLAPETLGDAVFKKWVVNGEDVSAHRALDLRETVGAYSVSAVYVAPEDLFVPNYARGIDPQTGSPNTLSHWPAFPVRVLFDRNSELTPQRRQNATAGMDWWVQATGGAVTYELTSDANQADITITFAHLGNTGWAGRTEYVVAGDQTMIAAHVYLNLDYLTDPANLTPAAAHEFGHALGIRGHSSDPDDLMSYSPRVYSLHGPSERDLNTLKTAYWPLFAFSRSYAEHPTRGVARRLAVECPLGVGGRQWAILGAGTR
ncbi:MAG: matrixin family metalloprotease [Chthonomonadales bacterium]